MEQFQTFTHENIDHLKKFYCSEPLYRLQIHGMGEVTLCCHKWSSVRLGNWKESTIHDLWTSEAANKLRQSVVVDRDFKYCNNLICPYLQNAEQWMPDKEANREMVENWKSGKFLIPMMAWNIDNSCQLKCSSCRRDYIYRKDIMSDPDTKRITEEAVNLFNEGKIKRILMTGAGDPFVSHSCLRILEDAVGIEGFSQIHLHTNGLKFTRRWYENNPHRRRLITNALISIDAGNEECYNIVRGGDWNTMMKNAEFWAETDIDVSLNIVLQRDNYKSLQGLVDIVRKYGFFLNIQKIIQWKQAMTEEEWKPKAVWRPEHPDHAEFVKVIKDLDLEGCRYSFGNLVTYVSTLRNDAK